MTLTTITRISTSPEFSLIGLLFRQPVKGHYIIHAELKEDNHKSGDYVDENGILWMAQVFYKYAVMGTVKPLPELNLSMKYKKI